MATSAIVAVIVTIGAGGVLAGAVALGVTNGGGASVPAVQVTGETPTSVPEGAATPQIELPDRESRRFDPDEARRDCPDGWSSYTDPDGRFALCYPPEVNGFSGRSQSPGVGTLFTISEPYNPDLLENRYVIHIAWSDHGSFASGPQSTAKCTQNTATFSAVSRSEYVNRTIASREWSGCRIEGQNGQLTYSGQLRLDVPFLRDGKSDDGYVRITVNYVGPDYDATFSRAEQVIETIRLP